MLTEWNDTHSRVGQLKLFFGTYSTNIYVNLFIHIFNKYLLSIWYIIMGPLGRLCMFKSYSTANDMPMSKAWHLPSKNIIINYRN